MSQRFPFEHFLQINPDEKQQDVVDNSQQENLLTNTIDSNPSTSNETDAEFSMEELDQINQEVLNHLKGMIPPQKFNAYFNENFLLKTISLDSIEFSVSTPFIKNMIVNHHTNDIEESIISVLGKKYSVVINTTGPMKKQTESTTAPTIATTTDAPPAKSVANTSFSLDLLETKDDLKDKIDSQYIDHVNPEHSGAIIDPQKTFDCFIVGPSNNIAFATAKAVAKQPGSRGKYPSLYYYSKSGLGKTHLLQAIANEIKKHHPSLAICLITARDFMKELILAMQNNCISDFQKKYSEKVDVLMIDDIHELKNKKGTQNEFFHVFNELYNKGKQLVFTSDQSPEEINGIEERIKTRLQWGLVIDIQPPDLETRIAILKKKAEELDFYLADDVVTLVAYSVKNSIRELEGFLMRLSAYSEIMKVEVDTEIAKDLLPLSLVDSRKQITLENVAKATSQHFKIPLPDLKSQVRSKEITNARHVAMYLGQKIVGATQDEIGKFFGGRDHSTVLHAIRKIKNRLKENDSNLAQDLVAIENSL